MHILYSCRNFESTYLSQFYLSLITQSQLFSIKRPFVPIYCTFFIAFLICLVTPLYFKQFTCLLVGGRPKLINIFTVKCFHAFPYLLGIETPNFDIFWSGAAGTFLGEKIVGLGTLVFYDQGLAK